jgi:hypothetical protein
MIFYWTKTTEGKLSIIIFFLDCFTAGHAWKMLFDRQLQILVAEKQFLYYNICNNNFDRIKPRNRP